MQLLDVIALFIALSGIFIYINTYYLRLPSSIGLMILALVLSIVLLVASRIYPEFRYGTERLMENYDYKDVLYQLVISFMLFAGALQIDFKKLAQEKTPVLILSCTGVLVSTFIIGTATYFLLDLLGLHLKWLYCLVFGALISPTDPIAVTTTLRRYNLSPKMETRIAGESLFNDGIAVVLALTLLDLAHVGEEHNLRFGDIVYIFTSDIGGGVVIGLILGYIGFRVLKYIDNEQVEVEVLITLALVMAGTQLAELAHVSSKQACVVMGLIIGNEGRSDHVTSATSDYVFKFWSLMEESFNAMLFVLIGLEMIIIPWKPDFFSAGFFAFNIVLFARWVSVSIPLYAMRKRHPLERNEIAIMSWGSMRGGMPIALSLSLDHFEGKDLIVTMTYIIVVASILYQGLTIRSLLSHSVRKTDKIKHSHSKL